MICSIGEFIEIIHVVTSEMGTTGTLWIVGPNRVIPNINLKSMGVKLVKILEYLLSYIVILSVLDQLDTILHYLLVVVDDEDVRVGRRKRWRNRCKIYDEARAYAG